MPRNEHCAWHKHTWEQLPTWWRSSTSEEMATLRCSARYSARRRKIRFHLQASECFPEDKGRHGEQVRNVQGISYEWLPEIPLYIDLNKWKDKCLSLFKLLSQNTLDWVAYEQQAFVSYCSGVWEAQDQGAGSFGVWWDPAPETPIFSRKPYAVEKKGASWVSFIRALISCILPSWPNHLPKAPHPNTMTLVVRIST